MAKNSRRYQRGKPLLDICKSNPLITTTNEFGEDDHRIFCRGIKDLQTDDPLEECRNCGAWVYNAEPLEVTE